MRLPGLKFARTWNPGLWFGIGGMFGATAQLGPKGLVDFIVAAMMFYVAILSVAVTVIPQDKDSR